MLSFCRHVTTRTLTLQRFFTSTKSITKKRSEYVNLRPFRTQLGLLYEEDPYPSLERRQIVAQDLGVPIKSLATWFNNRRMRDKLKRSLRGQDTSKFRHRPICTDEQTKILSRNLYPNASEMVVLAERFGMEKDRLRKVLTNLRYKARKGANVGITVGSPKSSRLPEDKLAILEDHFQRNPFPVRNGTFDALVQKLELPPSRVQTWFDKRRLRQITNPVRPLTQVMDELQDRKLRLRQSKIVSDP